MDEIISLSPKDALAFFGSLKHIKEKQENYILYSYSSVGTLAVLEQPIDVG
jgi:hypothetical protein